MTNPRQLAPTVGPAHDGDEFLEGSLLGFEKLAILSDEEESARNNCGAGKFVCSMVKVMIKLWSGQMQD